jgi:hypothetical protein
VEASENTVALAMLCKQKELAMDSKNLAKVYLFENKIVSCSWRPGGRRNAGGENEG